jgi:hypothetical protein
MTFISGQKNIATRDTISEKILWRNLNLPLLAILFVKNLVFITLILVISDKILIRHKKASLVANRVTKHCFATI